MVRETSELGTGAVEEKRGGRRRRRSSATRRNEGLSCSGVEKYRGMAMFRPQLVDFVLLVFVAVVVVDGSSLQSDKDALIDLKWFLQRNNTAHKGKFDQWTEGDASPCYWTGIVCTGCRVTGIDLSNFTPQTQGMLYPHFPSLTVLGSLDISGNTFNGPIPVDLGQCASLGYFNLSHNFFE
ncbi:hypothetical protein EJ110_NYTH19366 [Nymphaea thermarum]|nr:hypothetical protein EJ110_NYTH19366 [Nymphaea thermarum]